MGFGSDPLGAGPFGVDLPGSTVARVAARPAALQFDGEKLDFVADGSNFAAAHPVDAKFFNRLRIAGGTILSAPNLGQGITSLVYIDPLTIDDFVRDQVRLVSEDMIANGDIIVHNVQLDTSTRGRVMMSADYTNLRTGKRQLATVSLS
jgi:hypothetical protein